MTHLDQLHIQLALLAVLIDNLNLIPLPFGHHCQFGRIIIQELYNSVF